MRQLEVVAVSDDGTCVLLAADPDAARPSHALRIDDRLVAAVRGELDPAERRPSELSPKEIQARLRAGEEPDQVAKAAKIPVSRVMRYAGPVQSERDLVVEQARAAPLHRSRGRSADTPLGELVDKRIAAAAGLRHDSVSWTARRREDGAWVVSVSYTARGGGRSASWLWQPATRELTAMGVAASRLAAAEAPPAPRRRAATRPAAATGRGRRAAPARGDVAEAEPPPAAAPSPAAEPSPAPAAGSPAAANGRSAGWTDVLFGAQALDAPLAVRKPPSGRSTTAAAEPLAPPDIPSQGDRCGCPGAPPVVSGQHGLRRMALLVALSVLAVAVVVTGAVVAARRSDHAHREPSADRSSHAVGTSPTPAAADRVQARATAVRALLAARSRAFLHHDRRALARTLDPTQRAFRDEQLRVLDNAREVRFASWSYTFSPTGGMAATKRSRRYGVPEWAPSGFALHYRLAGYDAHPTDLGQFPTFTRRGGRWYLASLSDFRAAGHVSATDLWDYGAVQVVRTPRALVLGPASQLATMREVATDVATAVPRVDAVWRRPWPHKVVVLVPQTQAELGAVAADTGDLDQIAALSSAEVQRANGRPAPVGSRISINPANWPKLGALGRLVVLTHELTHVATRADTGRQTPTWLVEGFADYVGFRDSGAELAAVSRELTAAVRSGHPVRRLPDQHDFRGDAAELPQAYESAWLACRLIAQRDGEPALVRFYATVGRSQLGAGRAVAAAFRSVLGLDEATFTVAWRRYVQTLLAAPAGPVGPA